MSNRAANFENSSSRDGKNVLITWSHPHHINMNDAIQVYIDSSIKKFIVGHRLGNRRF